MFDAKHPTIPELTEFWKRERRLCEMPGGYEFRFALTGDEYTRLLRAAEDREAIALRVAELERTNERLAGEFYAEAQTVVHANDRNRELESQLSTLTRLAHNTVESSGKPGELIHERALAAFLSTTPPPPDRLRELAMAVVKAKDCKICPFCGVNGNEWEDHRDGCQLGDLAKCLGKVE